MPLHLSPARAATSDAGSALGGVLIAVVILAAVAIGAFFYFGGQADVKIKKPDIKVSSSETPN
jgi:hypothetical protein